jgi:holliday junction DNA helicase RuvB
MNGPGTRSLEVRLPPVTFAAATTNPERMPSPLRNRFRTIELSPYTDADLAEIVLRAAARDGFGVEPQAACVLARASSGTARMAIGLYLEMRVWVEARGRKSATAEDARTTLLCAELDENGFGPVHRRILTILRTHGRPLAHHRLLAQLGLSAEAYSTLYEPALIRTGMIASTPRGLALGAGIVSAAEI